jgi:transcription elongation factor Elf1
MGFRCPSCHADFGVDQSKLEDHLKKDGGCEVVASISLKNVDVLSGKKKRPVRKNINKKPVAKKRTYKSIDIAHIFEKTNIVTKDNMWDDVECTICGLKGERSFENYRFDKKTSYKKIEYCNPK